MGRESSSSQYYYNLPRFYRPLFSSNSKFISSRFFLNIIGDFIGGVLFNLFYSHKMTVSLDSK